MWGLARGRGGASDGGGDGSAVEAVSRRARRVAFRGRARRTVPVRPAHAPMDGDTVFAVATQKKALTDPLPDLAEIGMAAGDCLARAIARGVYEATPAPGDLVPTWRQTFG